LALSKAWLDIGFCKPGYMKKYQGKIAIHNKSRDHVDLKDMEPSIHARRQSECGLSKRTV
jgi:hypothetical protein